MIGLDNDLIYKYYVNMNKANKQESKALPNEKWKFCNSVELCSILFISDREPLRHMAFKKVKYVSKKTGEINFNLDVWIFWPWNRTRHSTINLKDIFLQYLTLKSHNKREKLWNQKTLEYLHFYCYIRTGSH